MARGATLEATVVGERISIRLARFPLPELDPAESAHRREDQSCDDEGDTRADEAASDRREVRVGLALVVGRQGLVLFGEGPLGTGRD